MEELRFWLKAMREFALSQERSREELRLSHPARSEFGGRISLLYKSVVVNDEAIRFEPEANSLLAKSDPPRVYLRGRAGEVVILILRAFRSTSKIFSEYSPVNSSTIGQ